MRGDAYLADFGKIGVHIERQRIREQPFYPGAAEFSRRQADAVHDNQIRLDARRARIVIWRSDLPSASHQSAFEIDLQVVPFPSPMVSVAYATIAGI
jgi:hypothetical protein